MDSTTPNGTQSHRKVPISLQPYKAAIFDLDGVITDTAQLHAKAWKEMFDRFLEHDAKQHHKPYRPFELPLDYHRYVDGKPRDEGIKSFLASRSLTLPTGTPADPPGWETVWGLGNIKNQLYLALLRQVGPKVYPSTVKLIHHLKAKGIKTSMVTSSRNGQEVLAAAQLGNLFDTTVDGITASSLQLRGKPAPDTFLFAAKQLSVAPKEAMVFEDAISGVEAAAAGGFGLVIGVNRGQQETALQAHGANIVVDDLAEIQFTNSPIVKDLHQ